MPGMLEKSAAEADKHLSDITAIVCFQDHVFTSGGDGKVKIHLRLDRFSTVTKDERFCWELPDGAATGTSCLTSLVEAQCEGFDLTTFTKVEDDAGASEKISSTPIEPTLMHSMRAFYQTRN